MELDDLFEDGEVLEILKREVKGFTPGGKIKTPDGPKTVKDFTAIFFTSLSRKDPKFYPLVIDFNMEEIYKQIRKKYRDTVKGTLSTSTIDDEVMGWIPFRDLKTGITYFVTKDNKVLQEVDLKTYLMITDQSEKEMLARAYKGNVDFRPSIRERIFENTSGKIEGYSKVTHVLNLYNAPEWMNLDAEPKVDWRIQKLIDHLFMKNEEVIDYFFSWVKQAILHRNHTYLCLVGARGVGKGKITEVIVSLIGKSYTAFYGKGVLDDKFNSQMKNKRLGVYDEIPMNADRINTLKQFIGNTYSLEEKGVDQVSAENHNSFIISMNDLDGFKLVPSDRRFSLLEITDIGASVLGHEVLQFISEIDEGMHLQTVAELGRYVLNYKSKFGFDPHKPWKREHFRACAIAGLSSWKEEIVMAIISKKEAFYDIDAIKKSFLRKNAVSNPKARFPNNDMTIRNFLKDWDTENPWAELVTRVVDGVELRGLVPSREFWPEGVPHPSDDESLF